MNRKQVFQLEIEYIKKDIKEGINDEAELIKRSKQRRLIPNRLRYLWRSNCYNHAEKTFVK